MTTGSPASSACGGKIVRDVVVAAGSLGGYVALGSFVSSRPPQGIDAATTAFVGWGAHVALFFTTSFFLPVLASIGLALLWLAWRAPHWRSRVFFSLAITLIGWSISDWGKDFFHRPRPEQWVLHQETSFSYSSGHAMYAVLITWLWAAFVIKSELPRRIRTLLALLLIGWGLVVLWSRLALGAHYPSDLLGGVLLGLGLLALGDLLCRFTYRQTTRS
ncbi:MAG TPA: phosphatase PAP2 family protein [Candidatus Baltobacteraceae bacterium]|jgi:membrane-associated phospholipid phosphatase|nr:phosphatase PAP2 family protein [Candidatus Baltobacteraceae bacterium]